MSTITLLKNDLAIMKALRFAIVGKPGSDDAMTELDGRIASVEKDLANYSVPSDLPPSKARG